MDLKDGTTIPLLLGLESPDGGIHYAQIEGFPQVFTLYSGWGEVLASLISDPPYPQWYYNIDTATLTNIELESEGQTMALTKSNESPKSLRPKVSIRPSAFFCNFSGAEKRFSKDSQSKKRNIIAIIFGVTGVRLGRYVLQLISAHRNFQTMMRVQYFFLTTLLIDRPKGFG